MSIEAMKQAVEALCAMDTLFTPVARDSTQRVWIDKSRAAIDTLRAAISQAQGGKEGAWGWAVNSTLFRGEFAEDDAKAEAKRCGGTTQQLSGALRPLERPVRPVATPPDMGNTPSRCRRHGRFETEPRRAWRIGE